MRVFVAGATGVLGQRVVKLLREAHHDVVGLSRSQSNKEWLEVQGAEARAGDLFDTKRLIEITSDCEAILHLATAIPKKSKSSLADWTLNDRIRTEGTRCLLEAALHHKVKLYLQQSISFLYGDHQGEWVDDWKTRKVR